MSKHAFEITVVVDDEALELWKADPRCGNDLPPPEVDDWTEVRDLAAAFERNLIELWNDDTRITNYTFEGDS